MNTRLLIILGGIIVGFWIFSLIFTQATLISIPYHTTVSGSTTINNEGKIIESFQVVPEISILQVTGFTLLALGTFFEFWEKIKTHKKPILIISGIAFGIFLISLGAMFVLEQQKLDSQSYDVSFTLPDEKLDLASIPHTVEISGLKQFYKVGDEIAFTVILKGDGIFCKGWNLEIYNMTRGTLWGNQAEENLCSTTPIEFKRVFQYSSFPKSSTIVSDKLVVNDIPDMHNYPSDYELIIITGYGDVLKRILHVTNFTHSVNGESLPPCTSDRTACFEHVNICDPTGWECGDTEGIFNIVIDSPLKQFKSGIEPKDVTCKQKLELVIKKEHRYHPMCVKPETKIKLIERGWIAEHATKKLWKSTSDWNSMRLVRNDDGLYCNSVNEELSDQCYSLEEIVFGNGNKKKETGWKLYPGGVGWTFPENSTLSPIYKKVGFGVPPLDLEAMLNDKIFVNKCESNRGIWNYTLHDCEGLWNVCQDVDGIIIEEDITPSCTDTGVTDDDPLTIKVCLDAGIIRVSCVFEYEN
jgi:hypothetical protein